MKTDPADEMAEARKPVPEQDAEVFIQHVDGFAGEAEDGRRSACAGRRKL